MATPRDRMPFAIDWEDRCDASGAKALRLDGYGLHVGAKADFVTLNAAHIQEAVVARPSGRSVYKGGLLTARDNRIVKAADHA